jgi:tetratricopeptide (TPR) repeat protein
MSPPAGSGRDGDNRTVVDREALNTGRAAPPAGRAPLAPSSSDDEPGATMMIQVPGAAPAGRRAPDEAHLVCLAGNDAGQVFPLRQGTILVGRGLNCTVVLNDPSVSRRHFNILRTPESWKLLDLGSGNGTKVDGTHVSEVELVDGTRIEIGVTTLRFGMGPGQAAAAAARPAPRSAPQPAPPAPVMPRQPERPRPPAPQPRPSAPRPSEPRMTAAEPEMQIVSPPFQAPPEPQEAPARGGRGGGGALKWTVIVLTVLVVGAGGFLLADKLAGLGIVFSKKVAAPADTAEDSRGGADAGGASADFEATYEAALGRMKERDWAGAIEKLEAAENAAQGNDADLGDVRKALRRARAERDAASDFEAGVAAAEAGNAAEAAKNLALVPDDSVYYLDAQEKLRALTAPAPGTPPPASPGERDALKLYAARDFEKAAAAFTAAAATMEDAATKSATLGKAEAARSFAGVWNTATTAAGRARYEDAIEAFEQALQLDQTIGGGLAGEVKTETAKVLVARGHVRLRKKELREAGDDFRRALGLAPDLADAQGAKKKLAESADTLLEQARGHLQNTAECASARRLFELVQWALPEGDPGRIQAEAFLESLKDVPNCGP